MSDRLPRLQGWRIARDGDSSLIIATRTGDPLTGYQEDNGCLASVEGRTSLEVRALCQAQTRLAADVAKAEVIAKQARAKSTTQPKE